MPRGLSISGLDRRGNLALAVLVAELEPEARRLAEASIEAHAASLLATARAAEHAEYEWLGKADRAEFAMNNLRPGGEEPRQQREAMMDAYVAASQAAGEALAAPLAARAAAQQEAWAALQAVLPAEAVAAIDRSRKHLLYPGLERGKADIEAAFARARQEAPDPAAKARVDAIEDAWSGAWIVLTDRVAEIGWPGRTSTPGGEGRGEPGWREHHVTDVLLWRRAQESDLALARLKR